MSKLWRRLKMRRRYTAESRRRHSNSPNGWSATVTAADGHNLVTPKGIGQQIVPEGGHQIGEGAIIEASVLARVLGMKLLTLEGTVLLSPARLHDPTASIDRANTIRELDPTEAPHASRPNQVAVGSRLGTVAGMLDTNSRIIKELEKHIPS